MKQKVRMTVNGAPVEREIEPRTLLVHFLREDLSLTGTNVGCETSLCGACTVLVDGKAIKSCTQLDRMTSGCMWIFCIGRGSHTAVSALVLSTTSPSAP
jgi:aerobic-type carbon monoxide dehydrogenase small subunit (CoxS/CutS family)